MAYQLTLSAIINSIVKPSGTVPLAKFMTTYPDEIKDIEKVLNDIIEGNEMSVLSWLTTCIRGYILDGFLQEMQAVYEDTLQRCQTKEGLLDIDLSFADGLESVYCFINKLSPSVMNRANALKYFMSSNIESKLSYMIIAYGVAYMIKLAFMVKGYALNKKKPSIGSSFECQQCGRCCLKYGNCLKETDEDIELWDRTDRTDILQWISGKGDLWMNESTGAKTSRCPFLRKLRGKNKYKCRIYDAKPEFCREYPVNKKQALEDGCPGLKG